MGEKKLKEFGTVFLATIAGYLQTHARQIFADDSFAEQVAVPPQRSKLTDTVRETLHFFRQGKDVPTIARIRGWKESTIYGHLDEAMQAGEAVDLNQLLTAEAQRDIAAAFAKYGFGNLSGVIESLGGRYQHGQCRVYRTAVQRQGR